ncbi:hypothetical protein Godav_021930 [Gossypium davidsonii]|uniref:Uncharacterized protein n=4 Tax=Gossypium TaxID=3633 RepID=A0A7J8TKN7_GOSDV|nr:hypothetical protein [Gossypium davidsonii]MBA0672031.1 hypothetical protein [Gossypium klotzschianum]
MDRGYDNDGVSCVTAGFAAASAVASASAVDASFRTGSDHDSSPLLGLISITSPYCHHHCSMKSPDLYVFDCKEYEYLMKPVVCSLLNLHLKSSVSSFLDCLWLFKLYEEFVLI